MAQLGVQIADIQAKTERQANIINALRSISIAALVVFSLYILLRGLRPVIDKDASSIRAFALVLQSLHVDAIASSLAALGFGAAWRIERSGKKRALKKKAELQRQIEQGDAYRSSSHNPL